MAATLTGTFLDASAQPRRGVSYLVELVSPNRTNRSVALTSSSGKLDSNGRFSLTLQGGKYFILIGVDDVTITLPDTGTFDITSLI